MSKHSPGPWRWTKDDTSLVDARGYEVAYNYCALPAAKTSEIDARLIAAAPELLAMLRDEVSAHHMPCDCPRHALIRRIESENKGETHD